MNKLFILLTTLLAVTHRTTVADVTGVTFDEFATPTGSLVLTADALLGSIDSNPTSTETTTPKVGVALTGGSGTGAVVTIVGSASGNGIVTITVTCGGSGYKVDDVLTIPNAALVHNADVTITLIADDITATGPVGSLKSSSVITFVNVNTAQAATEIFEATTNSRAGALAVVGVDGDGSDKNNNALRFTTCGSGYRPGDKLTIAATNLAGSDVIVITLQKEDIEGYVKTTPTLGGYRTVEGAPFNSNGNFAANSEFTGYYVALKKMTTHVQVTAAFDTAGTLTASLGATTDSALTDDLPSGTFFSVQDGLNIFKVISSLDGTYEFNLMKPDDNVKHLVGASSKRSIAIAYNPASVGEFTCSAFKSTTAGAAIPETRTEVAASSTDVNIVGKTRTHNIVPEDMFSSFQMSLNGLEPDTPYHIYCYHMFHGIISNTAATVRTDKGSLTGVSLVPSGDSGLGAGEYDTLTLTFTHEITLAVDNTIVLTLYNNYDNVQTLAVSGTAGSGGCGDSISATSGGQAISGVDECSSGGTNNAYPLTLTLKGTSTVASGTRGTEVIYTLTDDGSNLNLANNAAAGTIVTFDLEVSGHGKLQQQYGWTTS